MRRTYVVVATLVTFFAGSDAAAVSNQAKVSAMETFDAPLVARGMGADVTEVNMKRFLRVEAAIDEDDSEQRALPLGLSKLSEKLKPATDKFKSLANKFAPMAEKLTDKSMAVAVRLKPTADAFTGKLKPIAAKLKPIAAKLNTVPIVKKIVDKIKAFAQKIKTLKIGGHTLSERYRMTKFKRWFKQNKSPDDVKAMLKVGEGAAVNTKNHDLSTQYTAFYRWAQRDKEVKAAAAAAA